MIENYSVLANGIIKQIKVFDNIKKYDVNYIKDRYDSYKDLSINMSYLRLGYLLGNINENINSLLDVGYGNGDFLNVAQNIIPTCYGNEINNYNIPNKCNFIENIYTNEYDVVCFFDVLEHFENIYDIQKLKTKYIYISVPQCHYISDEWFLNWKHRRPDEHLWHFNLNSITNFMKEIGFNIVSYSNIEDIIRKSSDNNTNILTAIFKKD
jgi:hypothetical protein